MISFVIQLSYKNTFLEYYSNNKPVGFCFSVRKSFSGTYCCAGVFELCKRILLNVIIRLGEFKNQIKCDIILLLFLVIKQGMEEVQNNYILKRGQIRDGHSLKAKLVLG